MRSRREGELSLSKIKCLGSQTVVLRTAKELSDEFEELEELEVNLASAFKAKLISKKLVINKSFLQILKNR